MAKKLPTLNEYDTLAGTSSNLAEQRVRVLMPRSAGYFDIKPVVGGIEIHYSSFVGKRMTILPHVSNAVSIVVIDDPL